MKVLLVHPPALADFHTPAPLGLGYVGAALKAAGHEIYILDLDLHGSTAEDTRKTLEEFKPDWVGISALTSQYPDAKSIAKFSKEYGTKVVLGGIHASAIPEFILKDCEYIDFVVKGEGEKVFPKLLEGKIGSGVFHRENGTIEGSPPEFIENLDNLDSPWTVLDLRDYSTSITHGLYVRRSPTCSVVSSRGCPYKCSFCSASQALGRKIRLRSPSNFLDELEYLRSEFGIKQFQIVDDNFTFYPEHVKEVCQGIIDRKLDLVWTLPNGIRADRVDRELLVLMKEAGCFYVAFGIESGSPRILEEASKSLDLEAVVKVSKLVSNLGYCAQGFFLVGFPGETKEDLDKTLKFAMSLPLDRISVNPVIPLPGSRIYSELVGSGHLDPETTDWASFNRFDWFPYTGVSREELARFIRKINFRFYIRPKQILKILFRIRSWSELEGLFLGFRILFREAGRTFAEGSRLSRKVGKRGY